MPYPNNVTKLYSFEEASWNIFLLKILFKLFPYIDSVDLNLHRDENIFKWFCVLQMITWKQLCFLCAIHWIFMIGNNLFMKIK